MRREPAVAKDALHATEFEYGLQEGLTSVGFVIGSLMMAKWANRFREGLWITAATIAMGIAGVAYGTAESIWVAPDGTPYGVNDKRSADSKASTVADLTAPTAGR